MEKKNEAIIGLMIALGGVSAISNTLTQEVCMPLIFLFWLGLLILLPIGEILQYGSVIMIEATKRKRE